MKRNVLNLVAALSVLVLVSGAYACPGKCHKKSADAKVVKADGRSEATPCSAHATVVADKAPCHKSGDAPCGSHAALTSAKGHCKVTDKVNAVLASMPSIEYKVGDETVTCPYAADALAKKQNKPIQYVVGDQAFKSEGEANAQLASLIEQKVNEMKTVQFAAGDKCYRCPVTAKEEAQKAHAKMMYRVAGVDFANKELAEKAAQLASERLGEVKMSYKVGDHTFECDKTAGAQAKETHTKMLYVIGDKETDCPQEAKMLMAKAKLAAIVAAATAVIAS